MLRKRKRMVEFLIDENILGLDRYLEDNVKYQKVGDNECLPRGSSDPKVAKYASENNLIVVTMDKKLIQQCLVLGLQFVTYNIPDLTLNLAKNVLNYSKSNLLDEDN